ncbi:hypothetical protein FEP07_05591 [Burkholderia multivorans]|nr:hypothetical protein [Burkholderia multivorans]MDR9312893.1 hypothetical protein [Burkholderia multivorans]MDR9336123.1 hypothetical protein [Burkholderia multivorans]MDR9355565.1 hypothetical protein [Burkholderia multivorans]MDR9358699.1 hypothetical protein [Burkholderia multivorans]
MGRGAGTYGRRHLNSGMNRMRNAGLESRRNPSLMTPPELKVQVAIFMTVARVAARSGGVVPSVAFGSNDRMYHSAMRTGFGLARHVAGRLAASCRERGRFRESGRSADGGREVSSAIVRRAFVQNGGDANCAGRAIAAVADHRRGTVTADYSGRPRSISMVYAYAFRTSEFACKLRSDVFGAAGRLFPLRPSGRSAEFLAAQAPEGVGALPSRCRHRSLRRRIPGDR